LNKKNTREVGEQCVIDDDVGVRDAIEGLHQPEGFDVEMFASAEIHDARERATSRLFGFGCGIAWAERT
jgi:FixJ family two-component response regulator